MAALAIEPDKKFRLSLGEEIALRGGGQERKSPA
jgi:hypothetical protein